MTLLAHTVRSRGIRAASALTLTLTLMAAVTLPLAGQRRQRDIFGQPGVGRADLDVPANPTYDGRFTFARIKYTTGPGGYYYQGLPAWAHGYSHAERNLMKILNEVSELAPRLEESVIVSLDDPALCKYPVAYITEAGFWTMTDKEAAGLSAYLRKGGFVIFDDFRGDFRGGGGWENFEANMRRVIPEARFLEMGVDHPIFHSFFEISSLDIIPQYYDRGRPILRGLFENNDPTRRLMAMINYDTDMSNFWEFSGTGFRPVSEANESYKLGVNYVIYGLTH